MTVDIRTPGILVEVVFPKDDAVGGGKVSFGETGQHRLTVRPGTYGMRVIDSQVHWIDHQSPSPIPSRTEELALNDGSTSTFVAERRWQDYVRPRFGLQQETPSGPGSQLSTRLVRSREPGFASEFHARFFLEPGAGGLRLAAFPGAGRRKARCSRRGTTERRRNPRRCPSYSRAAWARRPSKRGVRCSFAAISPTRGDSTYRRLPERRREPTPQHRRIAARLPVRRRDRMRTDWSPRITCSPSARCALKEPAACAEQGCVVKKEGGLPAPIV